MLEQSIGSWGFLQRGSFDTSFRCCFRVDALQSLCASVSDRDVVIFEQPQQHRHDSPIPSCNMDFADGLGGGRAHKGVGALEIVHKCRDIVVRKGEKGKKDGLAAEITE